MVKTIKNLLLWNQKADDLETWYAASGAQVLPSDDTGLALTFLRQGQLWSLMLLYGEKGKTMDHSETIVVYDLKLAADDLSCKKFL